LPVRTLQVSRRVGASDKIVGVCIAKPCQPWSPGLDFAS
jgi:hypothetical protein